MPAKRFTFDWTCPGCGRKNHFSWPPEDAPWEGQPTWMVCEGRGGCNQMSGHTWNGERWEFTGDIKPFTGGPSGHEV